jgi:hypothetical protein
MEPTAPYKGPLPYFEEDADFFFGRDEEIELVCEVFRTARRTVLMGAPGSGKTSLLRAGVVPYLALSAEKRERAVVFDAWRHDPLLHFTAQLRRAAHERFPRFLSLDSIVKTIAAEEKLLIILDQFEECALRHQAFAAEIARLIDQTDVHFLLSVRDDEEHALQRLQSKLPSLFDSMLRLQPLTLDAARSAIVQPVEVFNWRNPGLEMRIEPETVDGIITAARASTETAHVDCGRLQRIAKALWDWEFESGADTLRASSLEALLAEEKRVREAAPKFDEILDDPRLPAVTVAADPPPVGAPVLVHRSKDGKGWRWTALAALLLIAISAVAIFQWSQAPEAETRVLAKLDESSAPPSPSVSPPFPSPAAGAPSTAEPPPETARVPPSLTLPSPHAQDARKERPANTASAGAARSTPKANDRSARVRPQRLEQMEAKAAAAQSASGSVPGAHSPSIFIHVREHSDAAAELVRQLKENGINVAGMKKVDRGPRSTDLRYFRRQEHDEARQMADQLRKFDIRVAEVKYIGGYEGTARGRQYELWFPPEALQ